MVLFPIWNLHKLNELFFGLSHNDRFEILTRNFSHKNNGDLIKYNQFEGLKDLSML